MGTPVGDVLAFAQCDLERAKKLLYGGPMMGICIPDVADPILKANNAILAFEKILDTKPSACIHCGRCLGHVPCGSCPRRSPRHSARRIRRRWAHKVTLCMNCGCCTYACPAKRPVAETNQLAKSFYMNSIKK